MEKDGIAIAKKLYEEGKTKEATFVRQLDKLEMHLQAMEYEKSQGRDLGEFFSMTDEKIKDRKLTEILQLFCFLVMVAA